VRQCGAGRRRTSCGDKATARSYRYCVTCRSATWMLKGFSSYTTSEMNIFHCDHCGHLLFFENTECVSCGHRVAYLPDLRLVGSLDPDGADNWRSPLPRAPRSGYRLCQNYRIEAVCNW